MRTTIYREVEVSIDINEILEECSEEQLRKELQSRSKCDPGTGDKRNMLQEIYEEFRRRGDAPQCLRDYIYETIGRIL